MCLPVNRNRLHDWEILAEILELGFSQVIDDSSLERELVMLAGRVQVDHISSPELRRVYNLLGPSMAERLQAFKNKKTKLTAAKEALDRFGHTVETSSTAINILDSKRKISILTMNQQVELLKEQKEIGTYLTRLEILLAHPTDIPSTANLGQLSRMRDSLVERFSLLEKDISLNMLLIDTLDEQIAVLKTTVDMLNEERNEAYLKAIELDGLAQGCMEENFNIDRQNENIERLIENELRFVHSIVF